MKLNIQTITIALRAELFPFLAQIIAEHNLLCEIIGKGNEKYTGLIRVKYIKELVPLHAKGIDDIISLMETFYKRINIPEEQIPETISKLISVEDTIEDMQDEQASLLLKRLNSK